MKAEWRRRSFTTWLRTILKWSSSLISIQRGLRRKRILNRRINRTISDWWSRLSLRNTNTLMTIKWSMQLIFLLNSLNRWMLLAMELLVTMITINRTGGLLMHWLLVEDIKHMPIFSLLCHFRWFQRDSGSKIRRKVKRGLFYRLIRTTIIDWSKRNRKYRLISIWIISELWKSLRNRINHHQLRINRINSNHHYLRISHHHHHHHHLKIKIKNRRKMNKI